MNLFKNYKTKKSIILDNEKLLKENKELESELTLIKSKASHSYIKYGECSIYSIFELVDLNLVDIIESRDLNSMTTKFKKEMLNKVFDEIQPFIRWEMVENPYTCSYSLECYLDVVDRRDKVANE